jgi:hypothetical protein
MWCDRSDAPGDIRAWRLNSQRTDYLPGGFTPREEAIRSKLAPVTNGLLDKDHKSENCCGGSDVGVDFLPRKWNSVGSRRRVSRQARPVPYQRKQVPIDLPRDMTKRRPRNRG